MAVTTFDRVMHPLDPIFDEKKRMGAINAVQTAGWGYPTIGFVGGIDTTFIWSVDVQDVHDLQLIASLAVPSQPVGLVLDDTRNVLYVACLAGNRLVSIDVTDPLSMVILQSLVLSGCHGLDLSSDGYLYVGREGADCVSSVDVTDPTNMLVVGTSAATIINAAQLESKGSYLYVGAGIGNDLVTINKSNPAVLTIVNSQSTPAWPFGVGLAGNTVFTCCMSGDKLQAWDIGDAPAVPQFISEITITNARHINVRNNGTDLTKAIVSTRENGRLYSVDITDLSDMQILDSIVLGRCRDSGWFGDIGYVTRQDTGALSSLDMTDPSDMQIIDTLTGLTGAFGSAYSFRVIA